MATLNELINEKKVQSKTRLTFVKASSQLNISAEVDLTSSEFHSLKVAVHKFPLLFAAGAKEEGELIIDYNFDRLGRAQSGYVPKVVVLSGINAAREAKRIMRAGGAKNVSAWVGNKAIKAMSISAADVSVNDLQSLLYRAITKAYGKTSTDKNSSLNYMSTPYVVDVYMFDNYAIVSKDGVKYRQRYTFDEAHRQLTLDGEMTPVVEQYEDVAASSPYDEGNSGPTQGGFMGRQPGIADFIDYGAPNSEANNPGLRLMLNVEEALLCYLTEILKGVWKVVYPGTAVTPPNMIHAAIEANIAAKEVKAKNFSVVDFLKWQDKKLKIKASEQTKIVNGEYYYAEDFGYVGDERDISSWFVPMRTSGEIKAASRKEVFAGVPRKLQNAIRRHIQAKGNPASGNPAKGNPHKFVMDADEPDKDMCNHKGCNRSKAHPIHKVR